MFKIWSSDTKEKTEVPVAIASGGSGGVGLGARGGAGGIVLTGVDPSAARQAALQHVQNAMNSVGIGSRAMQDSGPATITSDHHRIRMLMMRLRIAEAYDIPFDHVSTGLGGDHVYVFLVVKGEPVTLKDDVALFPSDTLVTQLRLLIP